MPHTTKDWIESFQIFAEYEDGGNGLSAAEHDEVYAGPNPGNVSPEHLKRLEELGWHDYGDGCFHAFV